jgi:hypothetical protein
MSLRVSGILLAAHLTETFNERKQVMKAFKRDFREGRIARRIEEQTAKLPSDLFLWSAVGSMGASLALKLMGKEEDALFIGQWAPTLLLLGTYNKIVKLFGSDTQS